MSFPNIGEIDKFNQRNLRPSAQQDPEPSAIMHFPNIDEIDKFNQRNLSPSTQQNQAPSVQQNPAPSAQRNLYPSTQQNPAPSVQRNLRPSAQQNPAPLIQQDPVPSAPMDSTASSVSYPRVQNYYGDHSFLKQLTKNDTPVEFFQRLQVRNGFDGIATVLKKGRLSHVPRGEANYGFRTKTKIQTILATGQRVHAFVLPKIAADAKNPNSLPNLSTYEHTVKQIFKNFDDELTKAEGSAFKYRRLRRFRNIIYRIFHRNPQAILAEEELQFKATNFDEARYILKTYEEEILNNLKQYQKSILSSTVDTVVNSVSYTFKGIGRLIRYLTQGTEALVIADLENELKKLNIEFKKNPATKGILNLEYEFEKQKRNPKDIEKIEKLRKSLEINYEQIKNNPFLKPLIERKEMLQRILNANEGGIYNLSILRDGLCTELKRGLRKDQVINYLNNLQKFSSSEQRQYLHNVKSYFIYNIDNANIDDLEKRRLKKVVEDLQTVVTLLQCKEDARTKQASGEKLYHDPKFLLEQKKGLKDAVLGNPSRELNGVLEHCKKYFPEVVEDIEDIKKQLNGSIIGRNPIHCAYFHAVNRGLTLVDFENKSRNEQIKLITDLMNNTSENTAKYYQLKAVRHALEILKARELQENIKSGVKEAFAPQAYVLNKVKGFFTSGPVKTVAKVAGFVAQEALSLSTISYAMGYGFGLPFVDNALGSASITIGLPDNMSIGKLIVGTALISLDAAKLTYLLRNN